MLIEFYGTECGFCAQMAPIVEQMEKETGLKVEKFETWHDEGNAKKLHEADHEYNNGGCKGVPFFVNTESRKTICGATSLEQLKEWAMGK